MPGQRRRRKPLYGPTPEAALVAWREWIKSGARAPDDDLTVREIFDRWLDWLEPNGPESRLEMSTWIGYETHGRLHINPWLGQTRASQLTVDDVENWLLILKAGGERANGAAFKPMSAAMRRKVLTSLRQVLNWASARDLVDRNVATAAGLPRKGIAKRWKPLETSETKMILNALESHRLRVMFLFALMLGPRLGELEALWWTDLDREKRTVEIDANLSWSGGPMRRKATKTPAGRRTVRLPDSLWDKLMEHEVRQREERESAGPAWVGRDDAPYIFTRTNGRPLRGDGEGGVGDQWKRCLKRGGVAYRNFHQTRHMAASLLLALNGNNLIEVQQILGHTTFQHSINLYAHLMPQASEARAKQVEAYYKALLEEHGVSDGVSGTGIPLVPPT